MALKLRKIVILEEDFLKFRKEKELLGKLKEYKGLKITDYFMFSQMMDRSFK